MKNGFWVWVGFWVLNQTELRNNGFWIWVLNWVLGFESEFGFADLLGFELGYETRCWVWILTWVLGFELGFELGFGF